jgi:hypothetical protein
MPSSSSALTSEPSLKRGGGCVNFCSGLSSRNSSVCPSGSAGNTSSCAPHRLAGLRAGVVGASVRSLSSRRCPCPYVRASRQLRHGSFGAEQIIAAVMSTVVSSNRRGHHLRGDEPVPNQPVEIELIRREMRRTDSGV